MARDVYRELLELAAFEGEELETALPEIKKTLDKLKVYEDDVRYTDIFDIAAEQWMRSSNTMNVKNEALANAEKIKANMPLDGVILGFFDFDRWMGAQHKMMAPLIEQEVGIPVYYIEGDSWDSREYNEETLRTKVESICQIVKMRKLQEQANG